MKPFDLLVQGRAFRCGALVLLTLILRIASASGPYYVDAFRHIHSIESGALVIHPPGYFLFNAAGFFLAHLLHVSAAGALQILNIAFSVSGAAVFYLLVSRLAVIPSPFWLALAYVCSPIVWFSGDIHSSYAAMTFFAPLLILVVDCEQSFIWGCIVWAVMTGFRPSDGVFVLPWMVLQSFRFPLEKTVDRNLGCNPLCRSLVDSDSGAESWQPGLTVTLLRRAGTWIGTGRIERALWYPCSCQCGPRDYRNDDDLGRANPSCMPRDGRMRPEPCCAQYDCISCARCGILFSLFRFGRALLCLCGCRGDGTGRSVPCTMVTEAKANRLCDRDLRIDALHALRAPC
jgi:hypothetical protein